jgi:hypothetical protein
MIVRLAQGSSAIDTRGSKKVLQQRKDFMCLPENKSLRNEGTFRRATPGSLRTTQRSNRL